MTQGTAWQSPRLITIASGAGSQGGKAYDNTESESDNNGPS